MNFSSKPGANVSEADFNRFQLSTITPQEWN